MYDKMNSPIGLLMLTILFIGLKHTGMVDWSWLVVFLPLWLPAACAIWVLSGVFTVQVICKMRLVDSEELKALKELKQRHG